MWPKEVALLAWPWVVLLLAVTEPLSFCWGLMKGLKSSKAQAEGILRLHIHISLCSLAMKPVNLLPLLPGLHDALCYCWAKEQEEGTFETVGFNKPFSFFSSSSFSSFVFVFTKQVSLP